MNANRLTRKSVLFYFDKQSNWIKYGLSIIFVAIAAVATREIPVIGERAVFLLFFFAIIQSAYWFGIYPGILATVLSFIAVNDLVMLPLWASRPHDALILNLGFSILAVVFIATTSFHRNLTAALLEKQHDLDRAEIIGQIGNWRLDVRHNELRWSDENHRMFGIPMTTPLTYEAFLAIVHPDDRGYVDRNWQAALVGEPYDIEHRIIVSDKVKWVRERAELEFDKKGNILGGFGTTQDITDLKKVQEELLESQQQYAGIVGSAMDAIVTVDSHHNILVFNPAAELMFGCASDEVIGGSLDRFIPEELRHAHDNHINAFARAGVSSRKMGRVGIVSGVRANGEEFPIEVTISQSGTDGNTFFTAILRDITDRKKAEDALRDINARYELVLNGAQDAIWDWDIPRKRVHYSSRWKALRGLSDNELSDREEEWSDQIHPDDKERVFAALQAHFDGKTQFFSEEYQTRCKDGSWKWILDRGIAQRDNSGQVIRMAGSESDITSRKLAEQALQNQEQKLRLIMDATPALISYLDTDFRYLRVNKTYENWFCFHQDQILGHTAREIIGDKAWGIVSPYLERAKAGERVKFDYQVPYGTGKPRWVNGNYIPDKDADGNVKGIVVHVTDIDDRKLAELERQKFVSLADNSQEFIGICDMNFMPFYINAAGIKLVGLDSLEQALKTPVQEFFFPEDQRFISEEFFPGVMQERRGEVEIRFRHFQTGAAIWMIYNVFNITNDQGEPVGLATVSRDITARKRAEEELVNTQARLALVVEELKAGYWDWDLHSNTLYLSPEWNRQLGLDDDELLLQWDRKNDRLHPDDRASVTEATENYIAGRQPNFELQFRLRHKDGSYRWIHSRGALLHDQQNRPYRMLGLNLDITDYMREKELNERRGEMEKSFQLYVATQTAAAIAHELNQPLTAISYYAYVAQDALKSGNQNPQKLAKVMEKCAEQAHRAGRVIQELLALLHKGETSSEPVDINKSVNYAIDLTKAQGYLDVYKIELNLAAELPLVMANALQIQKVLVNLLNNGLEAMQEHETSAGIITVTSCLSTLNPTMVLVSVCDSGVGVPDIDSLNKMFQPFHTSKTKGLGMGLAISRALVEAHGGKMWAEQNADYGITVLFTLPIVP